MPEERELLTTALHCTNAQTRSSDLTSCWVYILQSAESTLFNLSNPSQFWKVVKYCNKTSPSIWCRHNNCLPMMRRRTSWIQQFSSSTEGYTMPLLLNVLLTSKRSGTCMLHSDSTLPRLAGRMASINRYSVIVHAICHKLFYLSIQLGQPPTAFSSHSPNEPGFYVPYWHQTLISLL